MSPYALVPHGRQVLHTTHDAHCSPNNMEEPPLSLPAASSGQKTDDASMETALAMSRSRRTRTCQVPRTNVVSVTMGC